MAKSSFHESHLDEAGSALVDHPEEDFDQEGSTRRTFLTYAIGAISGMIALTVGIPAVGYIISPAFKKVHKKWVRIGLVRKVKIGIPTLFKNRVIRKVGWEKTTSTNMMYALTDDGKSFTVLSNVCTHLGCRVHWESGKNAYLCPCHGGVFDKEGRVLAGPPPRPLDRYEVKIEDGALYAGELYEVNAQLKRVS